MFIYCNRLKKPELENVDEVLKTFSYLSRLNHERFEIINFDLNFNIKK